MARLTVKRANCWALLMLSLSLSACLRPRITRRYLKQSKSAAPAGEIEAALTAFAIPVPASPSKATLLKLADRGQSSLIREVSKKTQDAGALFSALRSSMETEEMAGRDVDRTRWRRRVVFSVENRSVGPADRISAARIRLDQLTEGVSFESWSQFATKYDSADLGTLKMSEHRELAGDAGAAPSPLGQAGTTMRVSQDQEESVRLSQRYVSLTGALSPTSAELIEQGAPGVDLTGNVAVDLTLRVGREEQTDVFRFSGLVSEKGTPNPASEVHIIRQTVHYPKSPRDIEVQAALTGTIRKVLRGDRTLTESDDNVDFRTGTTHPLRVVLLPAKEQITHVWVLRHPSGGLLHLSSESGGREPVQLDGFDSAIQLKDYLVKAADPGSIGGRTLILPLASRPLSASEAAALQIEIVSMNPLK